MLFQHTSDPDGAVLEDSFADLPSLQDLRPEPAPQDDDPEVAAMENLLRHVPPDAQLSLAMAEAVSEIEPELLLPLARACIARRLRRDRQPTAAAALVGPERAARPRSDGSRGWYKRRRDREPANRDRDREVFRSTGVALGDHDLSDGAFRSCCQIQALCGAKGWCETNWCALAKLRGVDRKTIQRHIAELLPLGYIVVD